MSLVREESHLRPDFVLLLKLQHGGESAVEVSM